METSWPFYGLSMWRGVIKRKLTRAQIIAEVAKMHDLTSVHLCGKSHTRPVVRARWHAMVMLLDAGHTKSAIGRSLNRDRTTVDYGIHQHRLLEAER
jgi:chromosomal replication initiation ATPase DnaA